MYLLGSLLLYLSFAMLAPLLWAMWDQGPDRIAISTAVVASMAAGWGLICCGDVPRELSARESFAFVTLAWVTAAVFSALPFFLSGYIPSYLDAYFEALSGLTTTGATILQDIEALPRGLLFWRSMTHWLGGMGIIALFVAVFPRLGLSAGQMLQAELPGPVSQRLTPRIAQTAKTLWLIYILLTVAQTLFLLHAGLSSFDALTHTFATVATGGFSTKNAGIATFNNAAVEWIFIGFMLAAGCNFALYYHVLSGRFASLLRDRELRFFLLVALLATGLVYLNTQELAGSGGERVRTAVFQVVSFITTTGFATVDYDVWPVCSKAVLVVLMFFGGCGGSTAGAIKQIRILVVLKYLLREIKKAISPQTVISLKVGAQVISDNTANSIVAFVCLYLLIAAASAIFLSYLGYDAATSVSAVAATLGNVGPGLGAVGPSRTYAEFAYPAKILFTVLMLVGRLEIYTVFAFLLPESTFVWAPRRYRKMGFLPTR